MAPAPTSADFNSARRDVAESRSWIMYAFAQLPRSRTLIVNMTVPKVNSLGVATRFTVSAARFSEACPGRGTFRLGDDGERDGAVARFGKFRELSIRSSPKRNGRHWGHACAMARHPDSDVAVLPGERSGAACSDPVLLAPSQRQPDLVMTSGGRRSCGVPDSFVRAGFAQTALLLRYRAREQRRVGPVASDIRC